MSQPLPPTKQPLKKDIQFNTMLDLDDDTRLRALATRTGHSRGLCVRLAIRAMHNMLVNQIPTCANDTNCYVPHMHPKPPESEPAA